MTGKRLVYSSSLVVEAALLVVLGSCPVLECHGASNVFIRDNQVYVSRADGKEEKVTNDEEEKQMPTLSPFNEDLVLYHGHVTRAKVPATELVVVDMLGRRDKKRIPLMQQCRSILCMDWLTDRYVGVKAWNRGACFFYVILDLDSGAIVKWYYVGASTLSHSRKQIAFAGGVPSGYIPNPEYKALTIMVAGLGFLGGRENDVAATNQTMLYETRKDEVTTNEEDLISDILWSNDDSHIAFACKRGSERIIVVCSTGAHTNMVGYVQFPIAEGCLLEKELPEKLESVMRLSRGQKGRVSTIDSAEIVGEGG